MLSFKDKLARIKHEVKNLNKNNKIVFCLLICERLLPNYIYFCKLYNYGDTDIIENTINTLYDYIFEINKTENKELQNLLNEIEKITPDTDDYESIYVSFALDACTSLISAIKFIIDDKDAHIYDIITYTVDTVDMFIQERDNLVLNNNSIEIIIENDPLMINELDKQYNSIEFLKKHNIIDKSLIKDLRTLNYENIINII